MKWSTLGAAVVVVVGVLASACSSSSGRALTAPAARETEQTEHAAPKGAFIVWTRAGGDRNEPIPEQSIWLDEHGGVIASTDGIVLSEGGHLWQWTTVTKRVPFVDCEDASLDLDDPAERAKAHFSPQEFQAAALVRLDGSERREVLESGFDRQLMNLDKNPDGPHVGTFEERIEVVGSMGPLLFLRDHAHEGACGAHGLWGTEPIVIDIRTGARVTIAAADRDAPEVLAAAREKLHEHGNAFYGEPEPKNLVYRATEPRFDANGFHAFHTFLADVPFAYGASPWSSYAVHSEIPAAMPAQLAPYSDVPPAVLAFAAAHPDFVLGGFTRID